MHVIIASDNPTISIKLRHAAVQLGCRCTNADVMQLDDAVTFLSVTEQPPKLVLYVLSDDEERRIEFLRTLNATTTARILAVGPGDDPQTILSAVHAGAEHYLDINQEIELQLAAFVDRLTAKIQSATPAGRLTVVCSVGGGSGASMIASNLSVLIAQERDACILLDLDRQCGDQSPLFNLQPRHTSAQICENIDGFDQNMLQQSLVQHDSGVQVLSAPLRLEENRHLDPEGIHKIVKVARSASSDVVVDFGSAADGGDQELLQSADNILLVFRQDFPSLRRLMMLQELWVESDLDTSVVSLVANSCGQSKRLPMSKIQNALRHNVVLEIPDDLNGLNIAVNSGIPVVLESPKSPFAKSIRDLAVRTGLLEGPASRRKDSRKRRQTAMFAKLAGLLRKIPGAVAAETT